MASLSRPSPAGPAAAPDERDLVRRCVAGEDDAWRSLVRRYQHLVYAVIRRSGAGRGEEADLFQAVWIDIYRQLEQLRDPVALPHWIATVTRHKCYHWDRRLSTRLTEPWNDSREARRPDGALPADETLAMLERHQRIRESVARLPDRCRQLIELLFLEDPPRPYRDVARTLGMAVGSIGSLRGGCLRHLRQLLRDDGLL